MADKFDVLAWARVVRATALCYQTAADHVADLIMAGESDPMSTAFKAADMERAMLGSDFQVHLGTHQVVEACKWIMDQAAARNSALEDAAKLCEARAKDRGSFTGQETLAERKLDYEAEAALYAASKAIRELQTQ